MDLLYDSKTYKDEIYQMYQKIFEDPKKFTKYYFDVVYKKNEVLLAMKDAEIQGMIHMNPYKIKVKSKEWVLHYIVAVAVWKHCRRQGIMAKMLQKVLKDIEKQGEPFTYLIPANPAYYEPFDFIFAMDWFEKTVQGDGSYRTKGRLSPIREKEYEKVATYMEECMKDFSVHTMATRDYIDQQIKESKASDGDGMIWTMEGIIKGVFFYGIEEDTIYIRQILSSNRAELEHEIQHMFEDKKIEMIVPYPPYDNKTPKIMMRIISLEAWSGLLDCDKDFSITLKVDDTFVDANDKVFDLYEENGKLFICPSDKEIQDTISIKSITKVFFGYDKGGVEKKHSWIENITEIGPIYITEEV